MVLGMPIPMVGLNVEFYTMNQKMKAKNALKIIMLNSTLTVHITREFFSLPHLNWIIGKIKNENTITVKLDFKELLNKEQIGFRELFTDYNSFIP